MEYINRLPLWALEIALLVFAMVIGILAAKIFLRVALGIAHKITNRLDHVVFSRLRGPLYLLFPLATLISMATILEYPVYENPFLGGLTKIVFVFLIGWLAIRVLSLGAAFIKRYYDVTVSDNLTARNMHTRINVGQRIGTFFIVIVSFAALFLLFEQLRGFGVSLLASAGVAGLIIGFAAQKALGNLLAGIQIAITNPIRIDDVVIVEGEWGWIEEITLTYVIVRIWDLRRLVVPISYFIEKPFQNWTRQSADILGTVFLYTDYTLPLGPLREKVTALLRDHPKWDGKVNVVQVTECKEDTMEVRVLVSAANSPAAWDLRCDVREALINFIQAEYPDTLPKTRAVLEKQMQADEKAFG